MLVDVRAEGEPMILSVTIPLHNAGIRILNNLILLRTSLIVLA